MKKILILGPQGSGKGTQATILAKRYGIPALSMGQLCRDEIATGSDLGKEIDHVIHEQGNLVSDDIALSLLKKRLKKSDATDGYVLDGYPRNKAQAAAYASFDTPTDVLVINVPRDVSLERLRKRAEIEKRADDTPERIARRLEIYENDTLPVIEAYDAQGIVRHVNGVGTVDEVAARIEEAVR